MIRKTIFPALFIGIWLLQSSCATVLGGQVTDCQRTQPKAGEPARQVRVAALIANIILFAPGLIVDFATGAAYRPCNKQ